jgi:hypothetical protein
MAVDPKVIIAIESTVSELGQTPLLAQQLISWIDSVISGNETLEDKQAIHRRLELIFAAVQIESAGNQ